MPLTKLSGLQIETPVDISAANLTGITTATDLNATRINVTGVGTISNGSITNLTGTSSTITTFTSTNGSITNLTGTAATITTGNFTTGNIVTGVVTNFTSTNGSITNLTGTAATITTFRSTTLNADTGNIVTGVTTNFTSTNGSITNLTGTSSTITTFRSTTGNFTTGNIVTGVTTNFNAANVVITGVTTVSAGTALLPSISPSGDPNTGVFFPSADTVNVSTGGTSRITINTSGNIGIGFTPALSKIFVEGTGDGSTGITQLSKLVSSSSLVLKTYSGSNVSLIFGGRDTGSQIIQAAYSQNPTVSLRDININPFGGSVGIGTFADVFGAGPGASTFVVGTNGVERLRITSSGDVGINVSPSLGKLHVNGNNHLNGISLTGIDVPIGPVNPTTKTITITTSNSEAMQIVASCFTSGGSNSVVKSFIVGGFLGGSTQYSVATVTSASTGSSLAISDITKASGSFSFTMTLTAALNSSGTVSVISTYPFTSTVA